MVRGWMFRRCDSSIMLGDMVGFVGELPAKKMASVLVRCFRIRKNAQVSPRLSPHRIQTMAMGSDHHGQESDTASLRIEGCIYVVSRGGVCRVQMAERSHERFLLTRHRHHR